MRGWLGWDDWERANPAIPKVIKREAAWLEFQVLMLDAGAQIRTYIPDEDVWADIETRLTE